MRREPIVEELVRACESYAVNLELIKQDLKKKKILENRLLHATDPRSPMRPDGSGRSSSPKSVETIMNEIISDMDDIDARSSVTINFFARL